MFNGCEKQTENSVTRVTVPYRDNCLVMPMTSQSEWKNLNSYFIIFNEIHVLVVCFPKYEL